MMLGKLTATFLLVALLLPQEPDIGLGKPPSALPVVLERIQNGLLHALDKVRMDLKARGARKTQIRKTRNVVSTG